MSPEVEAALKWAGPGLAILAVGVGIPGAIVACIKLCGRREERFRRQAQLADHEGGIEMHEVDGAPARRAFYRSYMDSLQRINDTRPADLPHEAPPVQANALGPQALTAVVVDSGDQVYIDFLNDFMERMEREVEARNVESS